MRRRAFMKASAAVLGAVMLGKINPGFGLSSIGSAHAAPATGGIPNITLNNGLSMPQFGFGTWTLAENTTPSVREAVACGYRLFDTAQAYGNEKAVWQGIKESGIARKELFITTKISPPNMRKPPQKDAIDASIEALGGGIPRFISVALARQPAYPGNMGNTGRICPERFDKEHRPEQLQSASY